MTPPNAKPMPVGSEVFSFSKMRRLVSAAFVDGPAADWRARCAAAAIASSFSSFSSFSFLRLPSLLDLFCTARTLSAIARIEVCHPCRSVARSTASRLSHAWMCACRAPAASCLLTATSVRPSLLTVTQPIGSAKVRRGLRGLCRSPLGPDELFGRVSSQAGLHG